MRQPAVGSVTTRIELNTMNLAMNLLTSEADRSKIAIIGRMEPVGTSRRTFIRRSTILKSCCAGVRGSQRHLTWIDNPDRLNRDLGLVGIRFAFFWEVQQLVIPYGPIGSR